jgi:hypothetical protein
MLQSQSPASKRVGLWLAVIVVVGGALRLYRLDAQSVWLDEMSRVTWAKGYEVDRPYGFLPSETAAQLSPRDLRQALTVVNAHNPPLNAILLNAWMRLVGGGSDFAVRLPLALAETLSILGMFLAARRALGPGPGLWAAALVALSPFHVFYAQELNHYALAACLVTFSLWFYFRWAERHTVGAGLGLAATGLAALYTHYFAGIVLFFQALALLARDFRRPRSLLTSSLPYLAMAAGFAPYLRTARRQLSEMTDPGQIAFFRGGQYFRDMMQANLVQLWMGERGNTLAPALGLAIIALAAWLFYLGLRSQADRGRRVVLLINGVGPVALVAALYWATKWNSILWPRYQLFFSYAEYLPVAAALYHARLWRWVGVPALAAMAAIGLHFVYFDYVKEDWRHAAQAIEARASPGEHVVVHRAILTYSLGRYLTSEHRLFGVEATSDWPRRVAVAAEGEDAIWLVSACAEGRQFPAELHAFFACRYASREDAPVDPGRVGLTVTRYSQPRPASIGAERSTCFRDGVDAGGGAPWERAEGGRVLEGGVIDAPAEREIYGDAPSMTVMGWAFSTRGIARLMFDIDGRLVQSARHSGLYRGDIDVQYPAVPPAYKQHAEFWSTVDVRGLEPGVHALEVTAVHPDGSTHRLGQRSFVLTSTRAVAQALPTATPRAERP